MLDTKLTARKLLEVYTAVNQDPSNLSYCNMEQEVNTTLTNCVSPLCSFCRFSKYIFSSLKMSLPSLIKKKINSGMNQIVFNFVGTF